MPPPTIPNSTSASTFKPDELRHGPDGFYALPAAVPPLMYVNLDIVEAAINARPCPPDGTGRHLEAVGQLPRQDSLHVPMVCWYFANFLTSRQPFPERRQQKSYFAVGKGGLNPSPSGKSLADNDQYKAPTVGNANSVEQFINSDVAIIYESLKPTI